MDLSTKEFALLSVLIGEPTRIVTKDELLRDVWAFRSPGRTRTLDSHACRLREPCNVYPDAQRGWFCFGCGQGGTVYDLAAGLWGLELQGAGVTALRADLQALLLD